VEGSDYYGVCDCTKEPYPGARVELLKMDVRNSLEFVESSPMEQVKRLAEYTEELADNLLTFFDGFGDVTTWSWYPELVFDPSPFETTLRIRAEQTKRYTFIVVWASLIESVLDLSRVAGPYWYASAFTGEEFSPCTGSSYCAAMSERILDKP
jgi:hypothetical protein